jgi:hypothetical protein
MREEKIKEGKKKEETENDVETIRHSPLEPDLNHEWKETKWHDH